MATPTTALANVRAVKSWMDKPFTEFNDSTTTVYSFECVCSQTAYTSLIYGTRLSSAATAGLIEIIYTDSSARWVGDSNFSNEDGGYIRFVRKFARVPLAHDDYSSTVITIPPKIQYTYDFELEAWRYVVSRAARSIAVRSKLEYQYSTSVSLLTVSTAGSWSVEEVGLDTIVTLEGNQNVYESTKIERWMGDIYVAVTAVNY